MGSFSDSSCHVGAIVVALGQWGEDLGSFGSVFAFACLFSMDLRLSRPREGVLWCT